MMYQNILTSNLFSNIVDFDQLALFFTIELVSWSCLGICLVWQSGLPYFALLVCFGFVWMMALMTILTERQKHKSADSDAGTMAITANFSHVIQGEIF